MSGADGQCRVASASLGKAVFCSIGVIFIIKIGILKKLSGVFVTKNFAEILQQHILEIRINNRKPDDQEAKVAAFTES